METTDVRSGGDTTSAVALMFPLAPFETPRLGCPHRPGASSARQKPVCTTVNPTGTDGPRKNKHCYATIPLVLFGLSWPSAGSVFQARASLSVASLCAGTGVHDLSALTTRFTYGITCPRSFPDLVVFVPRHSISHGSKVLRVPLSIV